MTDTFKTSIDLFVNNLRQVNIACIDEGDRYVLYSVRVPSPRLNDDALLALNNRDDELGASLAAWLAARAAFWKFRK